MVHVTGEFDGEVDPGEPDDEDAGLPRPDVRAECDTTERCNANGAFQCGPVAVDDELPDGFLAFGDAECAEDAENRETLKEDLGCGVVGKADERVAEEGAGEEREGCRAAECSGPFDESPGDEVRREGDECPGERGHDQHDLFGTPHDRLGDPDADDHDVIPEGTELAGLGSFGEAGPDVEGHSARVVLHDVRRLTEVVPRVVAAEVHLAVSDEVAVRLEARPEHHRQHAEKNRDVIPPFQQIGRRSVRGGWPIVRLTHYLITTRKTRIRLVISLRSPDAVWCVTVSGRVDSGGVADVPASREMEALKSPVRVLSRVKVSVVVCTYTLDMYEHFREAADSVLAQTHDDVELVVVVDGTPEVYERVVEDYGDREDTVIECNGENVGLLASRNRGAELASGDVVAFIDDDAVADEAWAGRLVRAYQKEDAIAAGGKMTPEWLAGKPSFLPEEFYWLVGVTHRGFADGPGEVRNTFGSNISFRAEVFEKLDGFDIDIGGRKGDANLQAGETELCARMKRKYGQGVWYDPDAKVAHKIFDYRTEFRWLLDRAFWQGYSKRAMESLVDTNGSEENDFVKRLLFEFVPDRFVSMLQDRSVTEAKQLVSLLVFTGAVGVGYLYAVPRY